MVQKTLSNGSKGLPRAEAQIILFCPTSEGHVSGRIERGLRKIEGIKEVTINPFTHNVKVHYDPNRVTVKKIRVILKTLHSDRGARHRGKKRG